MFKLNAEQKLILFLFLLFFFFFNYEIKDEFFVKNNKLKKEEEKYRKGETACHDRGCCTHEIFLGLIIVSCWSQSVNYEKNEEYL